MGIELISISTHDFVVIVLLEFWVKYIHNGFLKCVNLL
jgi:hypothetical protein